MKRHRFVVACLAMVLVGLTLVLYRQAFYGAKQYRGDGIIRDSGVMSYPRYRIELPQIDLAQDNVSTAQVAGLPPVPLTFGLEMIDASLATSLWSETNIQANSQTQLFVHIRSSNEERVQTVQAPLTGWKLATSLKGAYAWHPALRDMRFRSGKRYTIEFGLVSAMTNLTSFVVKPFLQGGGTELP
jgi:hypothetical protein